MTPVYVFFAPLIALGTYAVWRWLRSCVAAWRPGMVRWARGAGLAVLGLAFVLVLCNNAPIADQRGKVTWHAWARDLLPQLEEGAWLLTPPTATDGFVQTWVLRYISWAENLRPEMTVVYVPDGSFEPPGPPPYYLTWEAAREQLREHPVYLIELNDERVQDWALAPVRRYDDWVIGYRVVGERTSDGDIEPWVDAVTWEAVKDDLVIP
jgi:hypothetical protein